MKKDRTRKKNSNDHAEGWIDVRDDNAMRAAGLWRPHDVTPRDPSVWTKTKREKEALKRVRSIWKLYESK